VSSLGDEEGSKEEKEVIQPHSAEGKATYSRRFFAKSTESIQLVTRKISSRRLVAERIPLAARGLA